MFQFLKNASSDKALAAALGRSQAVIEFGMDGTVLTANDNFLKALGYTLGEIQGKHHSMFVDASERDSAAYRDFWAALKRGEYQAAEYKRIGKGGREVWIQATYNPILDGSGKPCKVVKFATDITARKLKSMEDAGQIAAISRAQAVIAFEMDGVVQPPPKAEWTLELQRRLLHDVRPEQLRAARARYTRDDPRDTATPDDMARLLAQLQIGTLLPPAGTRWLLDLMARAKTSPHRLKALLPPDTIVAHKTGTTDVVTNDVGIITLPDGSATSGHIALAVFVINGRTAAMQQTIAQLSGAAFEFFTGKPLPKPQKPKAAKKPKRRRGPTPAAARSSDPSATRGEPEPGTRPPPR